MSEKQSSEGKPMFVESLMTRDEWSRNMKAYPQTCTRKWHDTNLHKTNDVKWRYGMGGTLSGAEIGNINKNLDYLLKKVQK